MGWVSDSLSRSSLQPSKHQTPKRQSRWRSEGGIVGRVSASLSRSSLPPSWHRNPQAGGSHGKTLEGGGSWPGNPKNGSRHSRHSRHSLIFGRRSAKNRVTSIPGPVKSLTSIPRTSGDLPQKHAKSPGPSSHSRQSSVLVGICPKTQSSHSQRPSSQSLVLVGICPKKQAPETLQSSRRRWTPSSWGRPS